MSAIDTRPDRLRPGRHAVVRAGSLPYALSGALATAAAVSAGFSFFLPSVLSGAEVGNGNLRGTAVVVLLLGVPTLLTAMVRTARGSMRWLVVWLGTLGYLLYQAVLFCFATPLNGLFLCYVAYLGLAVWSIVTLFPAVDQHAFASRLSTGMPARFVAGFAFAIAAVNAAVWLAAIVPALLGSDPASLMKGTGLLTNPVYVQDLAIWLPLLTAAAAGVLAPPGVGSARHRSDAGDAHPGGRRRRHRPVVRFAGRSDVARGIDDDGAGVRRARRRHRDGAGCLPAQHRPTPAGWRPCELRTCSDRRWWSASTAPTPRGTPPSGRRTSRRCGGFRCCW